MKNHFLYLKDYYDRPVYIDNLTKNKSFLKMSKILKKMGIQNNKFFLITTQKDLIGIDPHNLKDNSDELKKRIAYECKVNFWYALREIVRIPVDGGGSSYFNLNRANLSMCWCFLNGIDYFAVVPRQLGKTLGALTINSIYLFILGYNIKLSMIAKDNKLRVSNVLKLRAIKDEFPLYLVKKNNFGMNNFERISYKYLKNTYTTFVGANNMINADRLGRGLTSSSIHLDEICFISYIHVTYPQLMSSTDAAVDLAKRNNQPHSNIITTTAGRLDTTEGSYVYNQLVSNSLTFSEHFYDFKDKEELLKVVKKNSLQQMIYAEYNALQLGKTKEWLVDKIARTSSEDYDNVKRDYFNIWTYGSRIKKPIDEETAVKISESIKDPEYIQVTKDGYLINWYISKSIVEDPNKFSKIPMILGMDSAENVGIDSTALVFVNAKNGEVIGVLTLNEENTIKIALFIANLLIKFSNIIFIPEMKNSGPQIVDAILLEFQKHGIKPLRRIFNLFVNDVENDDFKLDIDTSIVDGRDRVKLGFKTHGSSRRYLFSNVLKRALKLFYNKINDKDLKNELLNLVIKNNRIDHSTNKHDDIVVAWLLCCYVLFFGKNLKHYTFFTNDILTDIKEEDNMSDKKINLKLYYKKIKNKILDLEELFEKESNIVLRLKYKIKIKEYKNLLPEEELKNINEESNTDSMDKLKNTQEYNKSKKVIQNKIYNKKNLSRFFV
jgi:hypothetical protein